MKESTLVAQTRSGRGTGMARRLRRTGQLPGIVNGENGETQSVQFKAHDLKMFLRHHTSEHVLLDLQIDSGNPRKVLLKEIQHHPVSGEAIHVDFLAISLTKKMRVRIPVVLVGDPVGVLTLGGLLEQLLRDIEVECLPLDMVESVEVNVAELGLEQHLLVRDLIGKIDPKLTVVTDGIVAVARVVAPIVEVEATAAAGAAAEPGAAAVQPEVITETEAKKRQDAKDGGKAPAGKAPAGKAAAGGKEAAKPAGGKEAGKK